MQLRKLDPREWQLTRGQLRLGQAILVGFVVAGIILLVQRAGFFTTMQLGAADYLYETDGDPGDDIVIVAIDEKSLRVLGDWPWPVNHYVQVFERLGGATAIGCDVLLPNPGPEGNPDTPALLGATRRMGNVVMPLTTLQLIPPELPGELYTAGQTVRPFPDLLEAAAGAGAVGVSLDSDGTLRRVPLLVDAGRGERWEAFSLQLLRLHLGLGDDPTSLQGKRVAIGDETGINYQVASDANGAVLINFVGRPNTFPFYSFVDVIEDKVPPSAFENRIVLLGIERRSRPNAWPGWSSKPM
jgi:CHASE2 domain-containing sensor protein